MKQEIFKTVLNYIAYRHKLFPKQFIGTAKSYKISSAKGMALYYLRSQHGFEIKELAKQVSNTPRAVAYSLKKTVSLMQTYKQLKREYENLIYDLEEKHPNVCAKNYLNKYHYKVISCLEPDVFKKTTDDLINTCFLFTCSYFNVPKHQMYNKNKHYTLTQYRRCFVYVLRKEYDVPKEFIIKFLNRHRNFCERSVTKIEKMREESSYHKLMIDSFYNNAVKFINNKLDDKQKG